VNGSWPLVGRSRELEAVDAAYADRAGRGGVVLVGEPGVGRTRLAYEAIGRLSGQTAATWWVPATRSAAAVPLGAFAPLLPVRTGDLDAMRSLLATFSSEGDQPAARRLVAVDDAHLLDDVSAALLFQLAAERHAFVLLTARTGAPVPDAVTALWRTETATRIEVPALACEQVGELLPAVLPGPVDAVSAREIGRICDGNPLLLRELLMAGRETGTVRRIAGVWRWLGRRYVTARLTEVVRERLGPLDPPVLALGELLACGGPIPLPMLEALTEPATVVAAERSALIAVDPAGCRLLVRLAHPIYADVLRAAMPRSRRRAVARVLAEALAGTPMRRQDDPVRAVHWQEQAGLAATADLLLAAATQAAGLLRLDEAERLARAAQRVEGRGGSGGGTAPAAALLLTEVLCRRGWYAEAARALPAGDPLTGTDRARRDALAAEIGYWTAGDPGGSGWHLVFEGRTGEALAAGSGESAVVAAGLLGQHRQVDQLLAATTDTSVPWGPTLRGVAGCLALLVTGQPATARELAERGYQDAVELTGRLGGAAAPLVGAAAAAHGLVARAQGRAAAALASLTEAIALLDGWHTFRLERLYHAELAATQALLGDLDAARRHLEHVDRLGASTGPLLEAWVERARSWVTAAGGDLTRAVAQAMAAADRAQVSGQPTVEALALFDAARFGAARQALDRLGLLARELSLPAVSAMARLAAALPPAGSASELDAAAHTLADLGYLLYAAEAATTAYTRHAQAGSIPQANASMVRAAALTRQCDGTRTPLLAATGLASVLTSREFQVARLAAAGHPSATIAARLGLSPRTVNNYLGRVYHKFGINRRTQLATVLAEAVAG
jgi:DNA-binding CsgD family transcriptional regulator